MWKLYVIRTMIQWVVVGHSFCNWTTLYGIKGEPPHDKTSKMTVRPTKTEISLGIHPVWSESSLCTQWVAKDPSFLHADSEGSDQTGQMPRLIWVIAGRTATLLVLSCGQVLVKIQSLSRIVAKQCRPQFLLETYSWSGQELSTLGAISDVT